MPGHHEQPVDPRVSVIINVFDGEQHVLETLESIAAQSFEDFEVLVWDDGSTDATPSIVEAFCRRDPRFSLLGNGRNEGLVAGRQQVTAHARGEWIAICDADDIWLPDRLAAQLRLVDAHDPQDAEGLPLVVVGACGNHINAEGRIVGRFDVGLHDVASSLEARRAASPVYLLNSSALFRRDTHLAVGGFRHDYYPGEDVDLWTRMAEVGLVLNLSEVLVHYRVHGGSISDRNLVRQMINVERVGENARRRRDGLPELSHTAFIAELRSDAKRFRSRRRQWTAQALYRAAGGALANGERLSGVWLLLRSALIDPTVPLTRLRRQLLHDEVLRRLLGRARSAG